MTQQQPISSMTERATKVLALTAAAWGVTGASQQAPARRVPHRRSFLPYSW